MKQQSMVNTGDISPEIAWVNNSALEIFQADLKCFCYNFISKQQHPSHAGNNICWLHQRHSIPHPASRTRFATFILDVAHKINYQ